MLDTNCAEENCADDTPCSGAVQCATKQRTSEQQVKESRARRKSRHRQMQANLVQEPDTAAERNSVIKQCSRTVETEAKEATPLQKDTSFLQMRSSEDVGGRPWRCNRVEQAHSDWCKLKPGF